jgi:dTDP-4-dehydrorhamnose reductase
LVHVSTDYVFDGTKSTPYVESDAKSPLGVYGRSKSEGEDAVLSAHAWAAVIRTSWVYSATGANFVKTMLRLAAQGREEIGVVADQHGRPTYAPDLAGACLAAVAALLKQGVAAAGVYHYAGADDAVWADVAEAVLDEARTYGLPSARVRRITTAEYPTPAKRPANSRLASEKFTTVFGFRAQDWRPRVADCVGVLARSEGKLG